MLDGFSDGVCEGTLVEGTFEGLNDGTAEGLGTDGLDDGATLGSSSFGATAAMGAFTTGGNVAEKKM